VVGLLLFRRFFVTSLEIPSKDKSYHWVLQWITHKAKDSTQHLSVETIFEQHENGKIRTHFGFIPGPGSHFIRYQNHIIQVTRVREKTMMDPTRAASPWENVTLTMFGRKKDVFEDLLIESRSYALSTEKGLTVIFTTWGSEWRRFGFPRKRRPASSVVLDDGIEEKITSDVKNFLESAQWYLERGIPYRRGYLLYGPPGCGKSSFITALAGELQYNICILSLSDKGLSDDRLAYMLSNTPQNSIILLEDVDAAFIKREGRFESNVTFSGLLNTLDGVASSEERIIFMTTNFIERLEPALIRPGRVDVIQEIGMSTPSQKKRMYLKFYPGEEQKAEEFLQNIKDIPMSMAHLQAYFMHFKNQPSACLDNIELLKNEITTFKN